MYVEKKILCPVFAQIFFMMLCVFKRGMSPHYLERAAEVCVSSGAVCGCEWPQIRRLFAKLIFVDEQRC
jgi:hypothetical protein